MANSVLSEFSDFFEDAKTEISKNVPDLTNAFIQPNMNNIVNENTKLKNEVERLKKRNSELNFELVELRMFKLMQEKKLMEKKLEQNNNDGFHCR
tara:strand:+ start:50 stop:334 length:285 start_codon:yes stop_codon:yes gene_type:complete